MSQTMEVSPASQSQAHPPGAQNEFPMSALRSSSSENDPEQNRPDAAPIASSEAPLTFPVMMKLSSAAFAFFTAGTNDGSLGALVPYIIRDYKVETGSISILFAAAFAGWAVAALVSGLTRQSLGSGGVLIAGAALQLLSHALRIWVPPFGLFAVTFFFAAVGAAFQDAQANTFVASVKSAHRWLGIVHASYGAGCVVGALVAAAISSSNSEHWTWFYGFAIGIGALNLGLVSWAFRGDVEIRKGDAAQEGEGQGSLAKAWEEMRETVAQKNVWLLSLFYFFYLGVGVTLGGWLVEYLVTELHGEMSKVGYLSTVLYAGTTLGRLVLIEPTHRFGERPMLLIYSVLCLGLQIVSWRVGSIVGTAVCVTIMGFLLGPFFAAGMTAGTRLIPAKNLAPSLGIIFVVAQAGGAVFPAVTGVIAEKAGVAVMQPILVGLIVAMGISWALVPKAMDKQE